MTTAQRYRIELLLLFAAIATAAGWGGLHLLERRAVAIAAAEDLRTCEGMEQRILSLQNKSRMAGASELPMGELARPIEEAARTAHIDTGQSIVRISPESPRRVGDSSYKEAPTQVLLRQVTLSQLIAFLHALSSGSSGLEATSLRLTAPREQEIGDRWTVETTLSYLIYAPKSNTGADRGGSQ